MGVHIQHQPTRVENPWARVQWVLTPKHRKFSQNQNGLWPKIFCARVPCHLGTTTSRILTSGPLGSFKNKGVIDKKQDNHMKSNWSTWNPTLEAAAPSARSWGVCLPLRDDATVKAGDASRSSASAPSTPVRRLNRILCAYSRHSVQLYKKADEIVVQDAWESTGCDVTQEANALTSAGERLRPHLPWISNTLPSAIWRLHQCNIEMNLRIRWGVKKYPVYAVPNQKIPKQNKPP